MLVVALAVAVAASALAAASTSPQRHAYPHTRTALLPASKPKPRHVNPALVRRLRGTVWRWQAVIGTRRAYLAVPLHSPRALRYWRRQARAIARLAAHPPHKNGWQCIH